MIRIRLWQRQLHRLINTTILRIIQITSHYKVIIYAVFTINVSYLIQHRPQRHPQRLLIQQLKLCRVVVQLNCWYRQKCKCKVHCHHSSPIYYWPIEVCLVFTISSRVLLGKLITTIKKKNKYILLKLDTLREFFTPKMESKIYSIFGNNLHSTNQQLFFFRRRIEKEMHKKVEKNALTQTIIVDNHFETFFFQCLI